MAIITAITLQSRAYAKGTIANIPETRIPVGITQIHLFLSRENWPDTGVEVIRGNFELSLDNRKTWLFWGGFWATGGDHFFSGVLSRESGIIKKIPEPTNTLRWLRGRVTALEGITTAVRVEVSDGVI